MSVLLDFPNPTDNDIVSRSPQSIAFEAMWRGLRTGGLVPRRSDFHPSKALPFLRDLVLLEVPPPGERQLRIRLAGTGIEQRIQNNIVGRDYLEFLPAIYHDGALTSAQIMADLPCGLWQLTNVHYERGTAQLLELTAFPLISDGGRQILGLLRGTGKYQPPTFVPDKALQADTALKFEFLEIGNGVPEWKG
jgi:hypothetical protein